MAGLKPDNGGPAFPQMGQDHGGFFPGPRTGMSLRDYFAGQALMGRVARCALDNNGVDGYSYDEFARVAYKLADAMLKERQK